MSEPGHPPESPATSAPSSPVAAAFPHVPGYRFLKRLGRGGMASVYLATQESLDRPVSIKVMQSDALRDEVSKQRFENEARTIARLAHPGIVGIHEVGRTAEGQMYYVMPYLANGDLSKRDLRGDEARIVEVLRTLLLALEHAHSRGIVHRDVKRENVLFDAGDRPFLTDFGIALTKADSSRLTSAGTSVGSSGYMAPEQARGVEVDARADLYSVGVLAFELLTGQLPYQADEGLALALMHAQDAIPRLPPQKRHWQAFVDRAMAKLPDQRFTNAREMQEALEGIGADRDAAVGHVNRQRLLLAGAALLLLATLVYAVRTWSPSPTVVADVPAPPVETNAPAPAPPAPPPEAVPVPAPVTPAPGTTPEQPPTTTDPPPATPPATTPAKPPATTPAAPAPRPTLSERAKKAKGKVSRWFRRH
ncbi:MAG: serine/threonine-protein kinase [Arenimonas sp.]